MKHSLLPKLWGFQISTWMNSSVSHPNILLGKLLETWYLNTALYGSSSEFPYQSTPEGTLKYMAVHSWNHEAMYMHFVCVHYRVHLDIISNKFSTHNHCTEFWWCVQCGPAAFMVQELKSSFLFHLIRQPLDPILISQRGQIPQMDQAFLGTGRLLWEDTREELSASIWCEVMCTLGGFGTKCLQILLVNECSL